MDESSTWHRRLAFVLARRKLRPIDLALLLGVSPAAVTKWLSGGDIKYAKLREIGTILRVNWVWLRYGEEGMHSVTDERRGDTDRNAWLASTVVGVSGEADISRTLGAALGVGAWMLDMQTGTYSTTDVLKHMLGFSHSEHIDSSLMESLMPAEDVSARRGFYKRLASGSTAHYTFRLKHRPNVRMRANGVPVLGSDRKVRRITGYVHREEETPFKRG